MTKTKKPKLMKAPTQEQLQLWHNEFARMLITKHKDTAHYGFRDQKVKVLERSQPIIITSCHDFLRPDYLLPFNKVTKREYNSINGRSEYRLERDDGKEGELLLPSPEGEGLVHLTYPESEFVLGTNFDMVNRGYSTPNSRMRDLLFTINSEIQRHAYYNAFEFGDVLDSKESVSIPVTYYRISNKTFGKLRE